MKRFIALVFLMLVLSGCSGSLVSEPTEVRTVTFLASQDAVYDLSVCVTSNGISCTSWEEFSGVQGNQEIEFRSPVSMSYNMFRVESEGYYSQRGQVVFGSHPGYDYSFSGEVPLTFVGLVDTQINYWRDYDVGGYNWRAELNFTMSYNLPLAPGYSRVEFDYSGDCEVYGEDYVFRGTVEVGSMNAYPSPTVHSINTTPYNNTTARCSIFLEPVSVDGRDIQTRLSR